MICCNVTCATLISAVVVLVALPATAAGQDSNRDESGDLAVLRQALVGTHVKAAIVAAETLGRSKAPAALDALLDALALGLHPRAAQAALASIAAHGNPRAYDVVLEYLHHRTESVRAAAVDTMAALDHRRTSMHILAALRDPSRQVRIAGIHAAQQRSLLPAIEPLVELVKRGESDAAVALGAMGNLDVAKVLEQSIGAAPDALVARALGLILRRTDFGPETSRVQVVQILGKVPGPHALTELQAYVDEVPANPPRQSRRAAVAFLKARRGETKTPATNPEGKAR